MTTTHPQRFGRRRGATSVGRTLLLCLALLAPGCAGYRMGAASLYAPNIRTVYVPMFESDSFRPGLGQWLTEAVVKEIELKTPYKVVDSMEADSVLSGHIERVTKRVLVEDPFDEPRETDMHFAVRVHWINRQGDPIGPVTAVPLSPAVIHFGESSALVPEGGQSIATAERDAITQLAERIVATMEMPW